MKHAGRYLCLCVMVCSLTALPFAETKPEWRPPDLGFSSGQFSSPMASGNAPKVELTLVGGFLGGWGVQTAEDIASDLLTGRWSPWFGQGYDDFNWPSSYLGNPAPQVLDSAIESAMLKKDGGAALGANLGFNISPRFQLEVYFRYGLSGYSIEDSLYEEFHDAYIDALNLIDAYYGSDATTEDSVQKSGKTMMAGLNFNIFFPGSGNIVPYVSLGGGILSVSDFPLISFSESHSFFTNVMYSVDINYESATALTFNGGAGIKYYLGPNFGLKLEARGNLAMVSLTKNLETGFNGGWEWTVYQNYDDPALTEKGSPFFFSALAGFFFGF